MDDHYFFFFFKFVSPTACFLENSKNSQEIPFGVTTQKQNYTLAKFRGKKTIPMEVDWMSNHR
jgi:hypothetical protein